MQIPLLSWGPSESPADLTGLSHPGGSEQTQEAIAFSALLLTVQAHLCGMISAQQPADTLSAESLESPEEAPDEDEPGDVETPELTAADAVALPVYPDLPQTEKSDAPAPALSPIEPAAIAIAEHDPAAQIAPRQVPGGTQTTPPFPSPDKSAQTANAPHGTDTAVLHPAALRSEPAAERGQADARAAGTPGDPAGAAPIGGAAKAPGSSGTAASTRAGEPSHREPDISAPQAAADAWAETRGVRWDQAAAAREDTQTDVPESGIGKGDKAPGRGDSVEQPSFEQALSPAIREAAADANPADKLFVRHEPIVEQLLYKLDFQALKRGGTLRIALKPDDLGGVTIRMEASPEGVLVRIEADSAQVREALDSQLGQLTASLRDCGVTAQAIRVQPGDAHEHAAGMQSDTLLSGGQGRQPGNARPGGLFRGPETTPDTSPQPEMTTARRITGINLYA